MLVVLLHFVMLLIAPAFSSCGESSDMILGIIMNQDCVLLKKFIFIQGNQQNDLNNKCPKLINFLNDLVARMTFALGLGGLWCLLTRTTKDASFESYSELYYLNRLWAQF